MAGSKAAYLFGAILTGWIYIALVDYAIGMEVFRFLAVFVLVTPKLERVGLGKDAHIVPCILG